MDRTYSIMSIIFWLLLIGVVIMVIFAFGRTLVYSIFCVILGGLIYSLGTRLERRKKQIEENLLSEHGNELNKLSKDAAKANAEILGAWDDYNIRYPGYPPDWDERRGKVKSRDGRSCSKCGWPKGYKRLARNLHVHHKVPLSQNGNNSFCNLVTLCHVCHKKEQGTGHKQIKYQRKSGRNLKNGKRHL